MCHGKPATERECYESWVVIFPGKYGLSWKLGDDRIMSKEEATKVAEKNFNAVVVPSQLYETMKDHERRMVAAEGLLQSIKTLANRHR